MFTLALWWTVAKKFERPLEISHWRLSRSPKFRMMCSSIWWSGLLTERKPTADIDSAPGPRVSILQQPSFGTWLVAMAYPAPLSIVDRGAFFDPQIFPGMDLLSGLRISTYPRRWPDESLFVPAIPWQTPFNPKPGRDELQGLWHHPKGHFFVLLWIAVSAPPGCARDQTCK
jgi:hypothetical protein